MSVPHATKLVRERFGGIELVVETLADLDAAVEELLGRTAEHPEELERDLCPYFGVLWPAARALGGELARRGTELAGKSVLELGCGLALPALVAAKCGARVTAADLHPDVPAFLARNLELNGLAPDALEYREHDWRAAALERRFDLVVGSDILYEAGHPAPVARALAAHVAPGGSILLADPARAYLQACLDELARLGFRARDEVVSVTDPSLDRAGDARTREVFLIELTRERRAPARL
jgi:predicted nicotinamide N-methyase